MRPHSRFQPLVEPLEGRDCPAAPMISLTSVASGNMVTLSGYVQDETPAGLMVNFSGQYNGSTTTDANGAFSITVTPSGPGYVMAETTDPEGWLSNMAYAYVYDAVPSIVNFSVRHVEGNTWTLTGTVQDEAPEGLTVYFGGSPSISGKSAQVQADGSFCLVVELAEGESGMVSAWVKDWWNQYSSAVYDYIGEM